MPQIDVIGIRSWSFKNDKDQLLVGTSLFYLSPINHEIGIGSEPKKVNVPKTIMDPKDFTKLGKYQVEQWDGKICACKYLGV